MMCPNMLVFNVDLYSFFLEFMYISLDILVCDHSYLKRKKRK